MSGTRTCLATLLLAALVLPATAGAEAKPQNPVLRNFRWLTNYDAAVIAARQQDKLILVYFSGSDWDPWTEKLDKEVFGTEMFKTWAMQNVILLQVDFPRDKHLTSTLKQQNEKLKAKYSVAKAPTLIFLDTAGEPITRFGYDDVKLRDEESKGAPQAAMAFLEGVLRNRAKDETLKVLTDLPAATVYAKKHYAVMLLAITQGHAEYWIKQRDDLFKDQPFVRFVNRSVVFVNLDWPEDSDTSAQAQAFRALVTRQKITASPFQLVLWDVPLDKVKARIRSFNLNHVDDLIKKIEVQLPRVDYTGAWITDFNLARTIAAQTDRYVFMTFTSMDGGEWSKKMDDEIFQSERFKAYARKKLVLLKIDYPKAATQPEELSKQNKMLAEMFNIKGFPTVVVLNPLGQKLVESKYLKGGPDVFMSQLEPIIQRDSDRLAKLKEQD